MRERLKALAVGPAVSIREAMEAIDRGACEIALVVDGLGRVQGTLTDGDIRRAILAGAALEDPAADHMETDFCYVAPQVSRAEVLDVMRARSLQQIPILDERRRLLGMHLLREIIGAVPRPNWAVIMAGGRGERLRPLTDSIPKPMVRVAGRPILERLVLHLVGFGIRRVFIAVHYKADIIRQHFGDGAGHGCRVEYLEEDEPLGTGGSLSLLPARPTHALLVINGDLVTQFNIGQLLAFHRHRRYAVTVGVKEYVHTVPYGVVQLAGDTIVDLHEKPTATWLANAGVYVLQPELLRRVPAGTFYPLPCLVEDCLDAGRPVGAFNIEDDWLDVGQPQQLRRARGEDRASA
jgi:dTDP-glucose pyrophosphorylase